MDTNSNSLNWFEIPATDITRAKNFYEAIFSVQMIDLGEMMGMKMVGFPSVPGNGKAYGGLAQSQMHTPAQNGAIAYLNANPSIQEVTGRIEPAAGKIRTPRTEISPGLGDMAF